VIDNDRSFDPQTDLDITGLEWWEVLQRLHQATRPVGPFARNIGLTDEAAMELIGKLISADGGIRGFNYVLGRPMKISFHTKGGQSWVSRIDLYDRDAQKPGKVTIAALRAEKGRRLRELDAARHQERPEDNC